MTDPSYGLLHRIAIPFRLVEMFFLPVASWIVLGYIVWLLAAGFAAQVLAMLVFFTSIVFLIAALGVQIEGEDWRLLVYAPLLVLGYKQFHDALNLKCLIDVLRKREFAWTNASGSNRDASAPTATSTCDSGPEPNRATSLCRHASNRSRSVEDGTTLGRSRRWQHRPYRT